MQTIVTHKFFVFRNDETGEICAVPRSNSLTTAKKVPDWVLETTLFKLALKEKSVAVVEVKTAEALGMIEEAKVENPIAPQVGADDALNAFNKDGELEFAGKSKNKKG